MSKYKESKEYKNWMQLVNQIKLATPVDQQEDDKTKMTRIERLKKNPIKFCKYYFPHYVKSDFGWFHKKAFNAAMVQNTFDVWAWPREHAKSVLSQVFIPMFKLANNKLTGMITISKNAKKAIKLIGDLKAELEANQRWINDYGELAKKGDWTDGEFFLLTGQGFWACGRDQTPRGARNAAMRPNYAVIDDIDDPIIVQNQERVKQKVAYIWEDVYGCLSIKDWKMIAAGNLIHKHSILSHLIGQLEPGDKVKEGVNLIKVYALEKKGRSHAKGNDIPAWHENYTKTQLEQKFSPMGFRAYRREYFHEHHQEGNIFKREYIQWRKPLPISKYKAIVHYCDPSWTSNSTSDTKAIVGQGLRHDGTIDVLDLWVRVASTSAMISVFYDRYEKYESFSTYAMEAVFMQYLILKEFKAEGTKRGHHLSIKPDNRSKPNKLVRIENMDSLYERGLIFFNEGIRNNKDTLTFLEDQLFLFPSATAKDDGPDAQEGGIYLLNKKSRLMNSNMRSGNYQRRTSKYSTGRR